MMTGNRLENLATELFTHSVLQGVPDYCKNCVEKSVEKSELTPRMRMLVWALIFAFFSLMTVSNLASFSSDFQSHPVTTSINLTHRSQVEFPAVTICNLNRSAIM